MKYPLNLECLKRAKGETTRHQHITKYDDQFSIEIFAGRILLVEDVGSIQNIMYNILHPLPYQKPLWSIKREKPTTNFDDNFLIESSCCLNLVCRTCFVYAETQCPPPQTSWTAQTTNYSAQHKKALFLYQATKSGECLSNLQTVRCHKLLSFVTGGRPTCL